LSSFDAAPDPVDAVWQRIMMRSDVSNIFRMFKLRANPKAQQAARQKRANGAYFETPGMVEKDEDSSG
jgi:hypothetical protein